MVYNKRKFRVGPNYVYPYVVLDTKGNKVFSEYLSFLHMIKKLYGLD